MHAAVAPMNAEGWPIQWAVRDAMIEKSFVIARNAQLWGWCRPSMGEERHRHHAAMDDWISGLSTPLPAAARSSLISRDG